MTFRQKYLYGEDPIEINAGRRTARLTVENTGDRAIQIGSHYHFFEVNSALSFDRQKALGMHLNIPAGTSVRVEPGGTREVEEVRALGVVEQQRVGERAEHAVGDAGGVAAFQALVVLDADAGQRGDLLAAQPRHLAAAERAQPRLLGRDLRPAAGQELRELVGLVHDVQGTARRARRRCPLSTPPTGSLQRLVGGA